jgi:hypothetical protein
MNKICSSQISANCNYLVSENKKFKLILQEDGNLVIYDELKNAIWASNTDGVGEGPYNLYLQGDGNLVIYDKNKTPTWASNTVGLGNQPYNAIVNTNGDLEIHDSFNNIIWSSLFIADAVEPLPNALPETQSIFFMPILTHAYYIVKGFKLTDIIRKRIKFLKQLNLLTSIRYNSMVGAIINFLKDNRSYIESMSNSYYDKSDNSSEAPSINSIGHINGDLQEEILGRSLIDDMSRKNLFREFKNSTKEVNSIFETILYCHYYNKSICVFYYEGGNAKSLDFKNKYLKYKKKYLELKSELYNKK